MPPRRAVLVVSLASLGALARRGARADVYMTPEAFVHSVFGAALPAPSTLWPSPALQQRMRTVLGHPYRQLRIRYWRQDQRTAWVLADVGKEEEITIGFVVAASAIERTDVLEFRESRGWEIRFPGFTQQFRGAGLDGADHLDRHIDGITGATLSVAAYDRLARLALMLHDEAMKQAAAHAR
jgi:hypothetical protein